MGGASGPKIALSDPTGVQRQGAGPELKGCLGPKCMFAVPQTDEKTKKIVDYGCAIALMPVMVHQLGQIVGAVGHALLNKDAPISVPSVSITDANGTRPVEAPTTTSTENPTT